VVIARSFPFLPLLRHYVLLLLQITPCLFTWGKIW